MTKEQAVEALYGKRPETADYLLAAGKMHEFDKAKFPKGATSISQAVAMAQVMYDTRVKHLVGAVRLLDIPIPAALARVEQMLIAEPRGGIFPSRMLVVKTTGDDQEANTDDDNIGYAFLDLVVPTSWLPLKKRPVQIMSIKLLFQSLGQLVNTVQTKVIQGGGSVTEPVATLAPAIAATNADRLREQAEAEMVRLQAEIQRFLDGDFAI